MPDPPPAEIKADPAWLDETLPALPTWASWTVVLVWTAAFIAVCLAGAH